MNEWQTIAEIRREYGNLQLADEVIEQNPFTLFTRWFNQIIESEKSDPTAMVLSTVDEKGLPDSRVVLLKGIESETFIFYTNYQSNKGLQLGHTPYAAINFYWPSMARQVRVRGPVKQTTRTQSDEYFSSRPRVSQIGAIASEQSRPLANRKVLEESFNQLLLNYEDKTIVRPENWGGYYLIPEEIEFWQGRDNRLHDRFKYFRKEGLWNVERLFP